MILKSILTLVVLSVFGLVSCIPPEPPPRPYKRIRWHDPEFESGNRETGEMFAPAPELEPDEPVEAEMRNEPEDIIRPAPRRSPAPVGRYPTATVTANPDQVLSPYKPYSVIDISGPPRFRSGQLARDPSNKKIFKIP